MCLQMLVVSVPASGLSSQSRRICAADREGLLFMGDPWLRKTGLKGIHNPNDVQKVLLQSEWRPGWRRPLNANCRRGVTGGWADREWLLGAGLPSHPKRAPCRDFSANPSTLCVARADSAELPLKNYARCFLRPLAALLEKLLRCCFI